MQESLRRNIAMLMLKAKVWHPNQIPLPPYAFDPFKYRLEKKI
jgi:hypothetical protein